MPLPVVALSCGAGTSLEIEATLCGMIDHSSGCALCSGLKFGPRRLHQIVKGAPIVTALHLEGYQLGLGLGLGLGAPSGIPIRARVRVRVRVHLEGYQIGLGSELSQLSPQDTCTVQ